MIAAIEIYNKPQFEYRLESFSILALNAWELLLKAKWLAHNENRVESLYQQQGRGSSRRRYRRARWGGYLTHSVEYLAERMEQQGILDPACRKNIDALAQLRHAVVHFYRPSRQLSQRLEELAMACVRNFVHAAEEWFHHDLAQHGFPILPLSFLTDLREAEALQARTNRQEAAYLSYLNDLVASEAGRKSRYDVSISIDVQLVSSRRSDATAVHISDSPEAPALRLSEEDIRRRFPFDYASLTRECQQRYQDFKVNSRYHSIRKELANDRRFAFTRVLNPESPRSPRQTFFSREILQELDKYYTRR